MEGVRGGWSEGRALEGEPRRGRVGRECEVRGERGGKEAREWRAEWGKGGDGV